MRFAYIAHPIAGPTRSHVAENLWRVEKIVEHIIKNDLTVWPIAPYLDAVRHLDDTNTADRARGMTANKVFFQRRIIDELWVCGKLSSGIVAEISLAVQYDIKVIAKDFEFLFNREEKHG